MRNLMGKRVSKQYRIRLFFGGSRECFSLWLFCLQHVEGHQQHHPELLSYRRMLQPVNQSVHRVKVLARPLARIRNPQRLLGRNT